MYAKPVWLIPCFVLLLSNAGPPSSVRAADRAATSAGDEALFQRLDVNHDGKLADDEVQSEQRRLFERLVRRADENSDGALSRDEFLAGLVPSRPEKAIEPQQPSTNPGANAVRYLLLSMDQNRDSWIESDEVPDDFQPAYEMMADRIDTNKNGSLDRYELSRSARELGQISARYVMRARVDVDRELRKLEKSQGEAAKRFDETPGSVFDRFKDPSQARKMFAQLDTNKDDLLELDELPEPLQPQLQRFVQLGDRDRDGGLSEREFLAGAERVGRFMKQQRPKGNAPGLSKADRKSRRRAEAKPADSGDGDSMPAEAMPAEE